MSTHPASLGAWTQVERPSMLHRRFEFGYYAETSRFLAELEKLSKETGLYPDLSFGTTHVNVTVYGSDDDRVDDAARAFADRADALPNCGRSTDGER